MNKKDDESYVKLIVFHSPFCITIDSGVGGERRNKATKRKAEK